MTRKSAATLKWRAKNREKHMAYQRLWSEKNKEIIARKNLEYRTKHKERLSRAWKENYFKTKAKRWARTLERIKSDPVFALQRRTRIRISNSIRRCMAGTMRKGKSIHLLGCNYHEFKNHIESLFSDGMSWELLLSGRIELDHKKPISSFNLSNEEELGMAFHYSNVQPLWKQDNRAKSSKILF